MQSVLTVYLQQLHSGSLEKIWTQGEKSREIWIAADVTFQTSQLAKVRIKVRTYPMNIYIIIYSSWELLHFHAILGIPVFPHRLQSA